MTEILLSTLLLVALTLTLSLAVIGARRLFLPARPIDIVVNERIRLAATTGEKLLGVLLNGGVPLPSACAGAGTCGLCRVRVGAGGGDLLPVERARLSPAQQRAGERLACQLVLRGPLSVEVPEEVLSAETLSGTVVSTTMLAPLMREIVIDLPGNVDFRPRAGSFMQVTAPPYELDFATLDIPGKFRPTWERMRWTRLRGVSRSPVTRAYSLANRPQDKGKAVFTLRLAVPPPGAGPEVPPGVVSSWLFGVKPGDRVEMSGPFGDFRAQDTAREMIFIGGGVGMAPLRAIIHDQLDRVGTDRPIRFFFGARSLVDAFYLEEFAELEARHPGFHFTLALSEPTPDSAWPGPRGFVHEVARDGYLASHPAPEDCEYYLCGPPLMIDATRAMLADLGVGDDAIFFDDFGS